LTGELHLANEDQAKELLAFVKALACFISAVPEALDAAKDHQQVLEEHHSTPNMVGPSSITVNKLIIEAGHMVPAASIRTIAVSLVDRACRSC
jgi:hypothetical protein